MRFNDLPSGAQRNVDAGHVWEQITGTGPLELLPQQTFRVRAVGVCTVTVGGVLAMNMIDGEIEHFNAGTGTPNDGKTKVTVTFTGTPVIQVARQIERDAETNKE